MCRLGGRAAIDSGSHGGGGGLVGGSTAALFGILAERRRAFRQRQERAEVGTRGGSKKWH